MAFNFGGNTTTSAGTGSGFGFGNAVSSTPAAPASSFSFGSSKPADTNNTKSVSFNLGGNTSAPAGGGFSFANGAANTSTSTTSTGFSFGGTTATPAGSGGGFSFGSTPSTAASNPGLSFGSSAATTTNAASTGFAFGGSSAAPTSNAGGFSFGATPAASATGTAGNTFGSSSGLSFNTNPATGTSSSSFSFGNQSANKGSSSLFGSTTPGFGLTASSSTKGSSFFGGTANATTGTGLFGSTSASPVSAFGQPGSNSITLDTPFSSLPADIKKSIQEFGQYIKEQDRAENTIRSVSILKLESLQENTNALSQDVLYLRNHQERQAKAIKTLKTEVKEVVHGAELAGHNMHCLRSEVNVQRNIELPSRYFWHLLQKYEERMTLIQSRIDEVEAQLRPVLSSMNASSGDSNYNLKRRLSPELLQDILRGQHDTFLHVAAHIAETHEKVDLLRQKYLQMLQYEHEKHGGTGAVRNPFEAADRIEAEEERRAAEKIKLPAGGQQVANTVGQQPGSSNPFTLTNTSASPNTGFNVATSKPSTNLFGSSFGSTTASNTTATSTTNTFGSFGAAASSASNTSTSSSGLGAFGAASTNTTTLGSSSLFPSTNTLTAKPKTTGGGRRMKNKRR